MKTTQEIIGNLVGYVDDSGVFCINGIDTSLDQPKWLTEQGFASKQDFVRWYEHNATEVNTGLGCGKESCGKCRGILQYLLSQKE